MNLLVINFEMNPSSQVLSWQVQVAEALAERCDTVLVLTHHASQHFSTPGLTVKTFPRWPQRAPFRWVGARYLLNLYVLILLVRHRIDACFIHMNFGWANILWPAFRIRHIPVGLWYAHGSITRDLERAHDRVSTVLTSTAEGFRLPSSKVRVIGQAIDLGMFHLRPGPSPTHEGAHNIVFVGRISRRKRIERLIAIADSLKESGTARFLIVGGPITGDDSNYHQELLAHVTRRGLGSVLEFTGPIDRDSVARLYDSACLHINLGDTGSMDKTVLEALSCGCPVITSNPAFTDLLVDFPEMTLLDPDDLDSSVQQVISMLTHCHHCDRRKLHTLVSQTHGLAEYADKILQAFQEGAPSNGLAGI